MPSCGRGVSPPAVFIGTHALLPVCGALVMENVSLARGRGHVFPAWSMPVIGLFGALPDICTPHLSLEARYTSWSHTAWFLIGVAVVCPMVASFYPAQRWRVALACWFASVLHLACDAISGGIAYLFPWRPELIVGAFYVYPDYWFPLDAFFILLTWFLIRLRPHAEARGMRRNRKADTES